MSVRAFTAGGSGTVESAGRAKADKRVLYVGGLEDGVTQKLVHAAFVPFGEIQQIDVPLDQATQKHRGFCFVTFELEEDATEALFNMNNSELLGRVLKVNIAKPMSTRVNSNKPVWAEADQWAEQLQESSKAVEEQAAEAAKPVETTLPQGSADNKYTSARASHILVSGEAMCKEIKGEIDAGADFTSKAKEHSSCPSSAKGGDLGSFKRGQMVKEFDDVVFGGRPGVLYGPVKTQFGYHLIVIKSLS